MYFTVFTILNEITVSVEYVDVISNSLFIQVTLIHCVT